MMCVGPTLANSCVGGRWNSIPETFLAGYKGARKGQVKEAGKEQNWEREDGSYPTTSS